MSRNSRVVKIALDELHDYDALNRLHLRGFLGRRAAEAMRFRIEKKARKEVVRFLKEKIRKAKK